MFLRPAIGSARVASILLGVAVVLGACAKPVRNPEIGYSTPLGVADPLPLTTSDTPYRLSALDRFSVSIYRLPELSREYVVEPSGIVNFPLVGEISVAGLTSAELTRLLFERYNRTQLRNPSISVQIAEMAPRTATIEGAVRTPGSMAITTPTTLLTAIARAGGPNDYANEKRVVIFRRINGVRNAAAFDLRQVREGLMEDPAIYPGDTVIVDGSQLRRDLQTYMLAVPILAIFNPFR